MDPEKSDKQIVSSIPEDGNDVDLALGVFQEVEQNGEVIDLNIDDQALLRKIDWRIMPMM